MSTLNVELKGETWRATACVEGCSEARTADPTFVESQGSATKLQWVARAMLLVRDHPDWSDAKIATRVGKHKSTLSRSNEYQAAAALARTAKGKKDDIPQGHQTRSKNGLVEVEAVSTQDDAAMMDWDGQRH